MWRAKLYASLQTGALMAIGDLTAQIGVEGRSLNFNSGKTNSTDVVDLRRTVRFAGIGLAIGVRMRFVHSFLICYILILTFPNI